MNDEARSPLVSVDWLAAHASDPAVRIVDVRWYLGKPGAGREAYAKGHLPGAAFLDVDRDLASPPGSGPGRHPLPTADAFARSLASIGVGRASGDAHPFTIVAYDDAGGAYAARLWWLLRYFGLGSGRVLDGGIQAWTAKGLPLSTDEPTFAPGEPMKLTPGGAGVVDKAEVDRMRLAKVATILDARAKERYEGVTEPIDARPGHIPGARSMSFVGNLVAPGGALRSRDELEQRYREAGVLDAATLVASCGSGVTACHTLLALAILGRDDALLYEGSWSDWARDESLPAATGPDP